MRTSFLLFCLPLFLSVRAAWGQSQVLPESQQTRTQATTGSTEVVTDKTVTAEKAAEAKDATEVQLQAGGLSSEGNARTMAFTGGGKFRLRRLENQFRSALAANYSSTSPPSPVPRDYSTTVQNFQGMVRYDRFVHDLILFLLLQGRNDRFAGYDLRGQIDPGVGYAIINQKTTQLVGELGYDLLIQKNRVDARYLLDADKHTVLDATGRPVMDPNKPERYTIHSARAAMVFDYGFSKTSKLSTALEFLQGINDTEFYRLNFDAALTANLVGSLSLSFGESIRFDNRAAKLGKTKTDYLTSATFVYTLL